ncbi:ABC transporter permease [Cohnella rhizosphaerae]|uniref:ABC transporter permease n=1 Tax=Cohnella rhizosphaerae TaxID=1457232 RepID=A0A9X4QUI7_9BACL|nr:ABC transporter permease [Cohnella rhizosphaerae]MDG0811438.1 ABC transporter permease [Cohnella rhizosphaerae]
MRNYLIKRLLTSLPLMVGITLLTFFIMQLAPGNPMQTMIDPRISTADLARAQERMGLNDPMIVQYFRWLGQIVQGNLGYTVKTGQSVAHMIGERLPATLLLTVTAFLFSFVVGVPLGVYSATNKYTKRDYGLTVFSFIGISVPSFFFGVALIYLFAVKLNWFPTSGLATINLEGGAWAAFVDKLKHLVLPALVLALPNLAVIMRFTRSSMIEVLTNDYIRTARAKGLSDRKVKFKHALRNAIIPVVTLFGISIPTLFGGAYITETIFNWPGMGSLGIQAITAREYPVIMGLNLFTSMLVLLGNLTADVLYAVVDPKIRLSK